MGVGALVHGTGTRPHGHHGVVEADDVALAATKTKTTTIPERMVGSTVAAATTTVVVVVAGDGVDGL